MEAPIAAITQFLDIAKKYSKKKKPPKSRKALGFNTKSKMWLSVESLYGEKFNKERFTQVARMAIDFWCPACNTRDIIMDFAGTLQCMQENAHLMHQFKWVNLVMQMFKDEVMAHSRCAYILGFNIHDPDSRRTDYFALPLKKWWPRLSTDRDKVRMKSVLIEAAKTCNISTVSLLLDESFINFPVLNVIDV